MKFTIKDLQLKYETKAKYLGVPSYAYEIAFAHWGAVQMTQNLENLGFTVVPFGQRFKDISPSY